MYIDSINTNNINQTTAYLLEHIKELNKLNIEDYKLQYVISDEDVIFLLKVNLLAIE